MVPELAAFLEQEAVPVEQYSEAEQLPRYVYIPQSAGEAESAANELARDLKCTATPVPWLPRFYELPRDARLAQSPKSHDILAMDAASGVAAHALDVQPGHHVLDLCCAPGTKLVLLADRLGIAARFRAGVAAAGDSVEKRAFVAQFSPNAGSLTGVDISERRLFCARRVAQRAGAASAIRLFCADGRLFGDDTGLKAMHVGGLVRALGLSPRFGEFDRVFVDAECTHDGSISHVRSFLGPSVQCGSRTRNPSAALERMLDSERLEALPQLQQALLRRGWTLLRPGGLLVYATCSFTFAQNEAVVAQFLHFVNCGAASKEAAAAEAIPAAASTPFPAESGLYPPPADFSWDASAPPCETCLKAAARHSVRFSPARSRTSGLFVVRIRKVSLNL